MPKPPRRKGGAGRQTPCWQGLAAPLPAKGAPKQSQRSRLPTSWGLCCYGYVFVTVVIEHNFSTHFTPRMLTIPTFQSCLHTAFHTAAWTEPPVAVESSSRGTPATGHAVLSQPQGDSALTAPLPAATQQAAAGSRRQKASSTLRSSRAVPHPSTNRALRRLTSEFGRDPVHSTRYGRQRETSDSRSGDRSERSC